jgi:hypothetical protein
MLEYPEAVDAAVLHQYGPGAELANVDKMNRRHDVAKTLLATKYSGLRSELKDRAASQHDAELKEWRLILDGISSAQDVVVCVLFFRLFLAFVNSHLFHRARDNLFDAVYPLLQAIGTYADCYVSLVVGNPKTDTDKGFFTA